MKINEKFKKYLIHDFQTIYNKQMLILFGILFAIYAISDMGAVFFLIPLSFALIPFRRDDYQNVSKNQKNVNMVQARYVFTLSLLFIVIIISFVISTLVTIFKESSADLISIYSIILMTIIFLTISGLLLPIFYSFGFKKGQYLLYLVIIIFALVNLYQSKIPVLRSIQDLNNANPFLVLISGLLISTLIYIFSYFISSKIIKKNKS